MKFAYFAFPHLGGTYSVFRNLRQGLAASGIEVRWLSAGADVHSRAHSDPYFQTQLDYGQVAGNAKDNAIEQARALTGALVEGGFDGVFVNVCADPIQTNLARYLPPHILRVMIVHSITPGTYAAAASIRDHAHTTVAISCRIRDDLVAHHGFDPARVVLIPHGIDIAAFAPSPRRFDASEMRVLFLGRIEDRSKGVFWLPPILKALRTKVRLTVAGGGPDFEVLQKQMQDSRHHVAFLGDVSPKAAQELAARHDIFLMPSRYEGFGLALGEAMAAGCVPVASRIRGVTDMMVRHGQNGLLFPVGDTFAAAEAIDRLAQNGGLRAAMSARARETIGQYFDIGEVAEAYRYRIEALAAAPPSIAPTLDLSAWHMPRGLRVGLRALLPDPIKNTLRQWKERSAARAHRSFPMG